MKKRIHDKNLPDRELFQESDINATASANDCTGLIPTPVKSDAEAESYNELFSVYQPDGVNPPTKPTDANANSGTIPHRRAVKQK